MPRQARLDAPGTLALETDTAMIVKIYEQITHRICCKRDKDEEVNIKALRAGSRRRIVSRLRKRLIRNLVEDFGLSLTETGRNLGFSSSAVAKALSRRNIEVIKSS